MKKKVLMYLTALVSAVSMQSCATNYVVAKPSTYNKEYKSNAKLMALDSKIENDKKLLIQSFVSEKRVEIANAKNALKSTKIAYNKIIDQLLEEAHTYIGTPYRYGGMSRSGIDCSAFVLSVFGAAAGMSLPRVAAAQAQEGEKIEKENLQRGDLVFFSHGRRISHVGIVESIEENGEVHFIHASTSRGVMVSSLNDSYWGPKYRYAKRILSEKEALEESLATALN